MVTVEKGVPDNEIGQTAAINVFVRVEWAFEKADKIHESTA